MKEHYHLPSTYPYSLLSLDCSDLDRHIDTQAINLRVLLQFLSPLISHIQAVRELGQ
jgi:hypothetical protein